jgi:uncharacterized SAM-binding protein YcdF (DUF218 family)
VNSAAILRAKGVSEVYLVTHAWHMARARRVFLRAGIKVIPAPTGFSVQGKIDAGSFLPTAKGMETVYFAAYEYLGSLYYGLRTLMAGPSGAPALS